jgi:hypothetical protein
MEQGRSHVKAVSFGNYSTVSRSNTDPWVVRKVHGEL